MLRRANNQDLILVVGKTEVFVEEAEAGVTIGLGEKLSRPIEEIFDMSKSWVRVEIEDRRKIN